VNPFVEADKARRQAYEQRRTQFADAVASGTPRAAETSARAAKMAAVAALLAAAGAIGH
jgi:hypothetical protein